MRKSVSEDEDLGLGESVDDLISKIKAISPDLGSDEYLDEIPLPDPATIRLAIGPVLSMAESSLRNRQAASDPSPDARMVLTLLWRNWPDLKLAVYSFISFVEKIPKAEPTPRFMRLFLVWAQRSPEVRVLKKLLDVLVAMMQASKERAERPAASDIREFADDISALLRDASRVRGRWLTPDHRDSPGGLQFHAAVETMFANLLSGIAGTPVSTSVFHKRRPPQEEFAGPLGEFLKEARRVLEEPLGALSARCTSLLERLRESFPDLPIAMRHRPSTAQRDGRLLALRSAGATIPEMVAYEVETSNREFKAGAMREAIGRARRRRRTRPRDANSTKLTDGS